MIDRETAIAAGDEAEAVAAKRFRGEYVSDAEQAACDHDMDILDQVALENPDLAEEIDDREQERFDETVVETICESLDDSDGF